MTDLLETLHEMVQNGLSWATLLSVILFISKMREARIRAKERAEMRQDIKSIKQAVIKGESECAVTLNPTSACLPRRGVATCMYSWAASFSARCVNKFMNYQRRKKTMQSNQINWATLVPCLLGAVKLILQPMGINIPDQNLNEIANGIAALATVIGIIYSHRKQSATAQQPNSKNFIQG